MSSPCSRSRRAHVAVSLNFLPRPSVCTCTEHVLKCSFLLCAKLEGARSHELFRNQAGGAGIVTRALLSQTAGLPHPRHLARRLGLGGTGHSSSGPGWSEPERWAWEEIRAGRIADFNEREGKLDPLDPRKPDGWGDKRKLSPDFLKEILFREPYRSVIPIEGVRIIGAWFPRSVDLAHGRLDRQLWLDKCRFEGAASLINLDVDDLLSLAGSAFVAELPDADLINLSYAKVGGLNMRHRAPSRT